MNLYNDNLENALIIRKQLCISFINPHMLFSIFQLPIHFSNLKTQFKMSADPRSAGLIMSTLAVMQTALI